MEKILNDLVENVKKNFSNELNPEELSVSSLNGITVISIAKRPDVFPSGVASYSKANGCACKIQELINNYTNYNIEVEEGTFDYRFRFL